MNKIFPNSTIAFIDKDGSEAGNAFRKFGLTEAEIYDYLRTGYNVELYDGADPKGQGFRNQEWNIIRTDSDCFCGIIMIPEVKTAEMEIDTEEEE